SSSVAPETVIDPSITLPVAKKTKIKRKISSVIKEAKKAKKTLDEERFRDSRGSGSRMRFFELQQGLVSIKTIGRKTKEGFLIYKEDELGILFEGGGNVFHPLIFILYMNCWIDTPLCPFDCQCCKYLLTFSSIKTIYIDHQGF